MNARLEIAPTTILVARGKTRLASTSTPSSLPRKKSARGMTPRSASDAVDGVTVAAIMRSSKTTSDRTNGFCGPGQKSAAPRTATCVSFYSDRPGALLTGASVG
jgi:hypothetical protein